MSKIQVSNEIGTLRKVLVHRPDTGISRISPRRSEELLFDDIVHLPHMQKEHDVFTSILEYFVGKENVLEAQEMLEEGLRIHNNLREELIKLIVDFEELPKSFNDVMNGLDDTTLAKVLITGYYKAEDMFLFDPIPNFIFTRDIAVTINDHILITKAAKTARYRENLLARFIFIAHPMFSELKEAGRLINLNDVERFPPSRRGERISMEGGDMMIINKDCLLVGCSERTTQHAINMVRDLLFEKGVIKVLAQINIPSYRAFMHIDTIFTHIDQTEVAAFSPIVIDGVSSNVVVHHKNGATDRYASIAEFFHGEIDEKMTFIKAGSGMSPYQEREQWTDGCNLVTLRPGVGVTYDRNLHTDKAFREKGYTVVDADDFLNKVRYERIPPESIEKTIITLPSGELSRARGGSHCMTCPLWRDDF